MHMPRRGESPWYGIGLLAVTACAAAGPAATPRDRQRRADRAPSVAGAIVAVDSAPDLAPARRVLVQTSDTSGGSTGRVWVGIWEQTPVLDARGRRVALGALMPGVRLRAWSQVIKHSDPGQTGAGSVVVDARP